MFVVYYSNRLIYEIVRIVRKLDNVNGQYSRVFIGCYTIILFIS